MNARRTALRTAGRCFATLCAAVLLTTAAAGCGGDGSAGTSTTTGATAGLAGIDVPGYDVQQLSGTDEGFPGVDPARVAEFADDVKAYRVSTVDGTPVGGMFVFALNDAARATPDVAVAYGKGVSGGDESKVRAVDSNGVRVITVENAAGLDHIVFTSGGNRFLYDVFGADGAAVRRFLGELAAAS